ncbi:MAG: type VI secretion system tube protein TssD [Lentimicrobium sp.]
MSSFTAEIVIGSNTFKVLDADISYYQHTLGGGMPSSEIQGGTFTVKIESSSGPQYDMLSEWMLEKSSMKKGVLRFYKKDGVGKLFDFEFYDAHCIRYSEHFSSNSDQPMVTTLTISPGITKMREQVKERPWKVSSPEESNDEILASLFEKETAREAAGIEEAEETGPPKPCSRQSIELHEAIDKKFPQDDPRNKKAHELVNKYVGHPVNVVTGELFTKQEDFSIPGVIPLVWERRYYSDSKYNGPQGYGWHHSYDWALQYDTTERLAIVRMGDGRIAMFDQIPVNSTDEWRYNRSDKLFLAKHADGHYFVRDRDNSEYNFSDFPVRGKERLLTSICNTSGFAILFNYDLKGNLTGITDTAGRRFLIEHDINGRIISVDAPHPEEEDKTFPIANYEYDGIGNLIRQTNAAGAFLCFEYQHHLLVKESWRNGLNWFFVYDGNQSGAKCVETWGDGDLLHNRLTYLEGETQTLNSLGHTTIYFHSKGLVTKRADANDNEWQTYYNEYDEVQWESDPQGNMQRYAYDEWGNIAVYTDAAGASVKTKYLDGNFLGLPEETIDANGGRWKWYFNKQGRLIKRTDPLEADTLFKYTDGLLSAVVDAKGNQTSLEYDRFYSLQKVITPDGNNSQWKYDLLGRSIEVTDPKGNIRQFKLDLPGRPHTILEPDGNIRKFTFDEDDNVILAGDKLQEVAFQYNGMGSMVSRSENNTSILFKYDTEDQLTTIINEHGYHYLFELDPVGDVIKETGFDGITRSYLRDISGKVTKVLRPGGMETAYRYDPTGRVTKVSHSDGSTESFGYRPGGELMEAANADAVVRFQRDLLGRVVQENVGDEWVKSVYDSLGNRTAITSSLGADIAHAYDIMGDPQSLKAGDWQASFERDAFGLETLRNLPGGIKSQWKRDHLGRPVAHHIANGVGHTNRHRSYRWDVNDRLKEITDSVSGTRQFTHDAFGNLASTLYSNGFEELRMPDAVGNLYRTHDRRDRKYGPAGQLLEDNGTKYSYDPEGNLIEKREKDGKTWQYAWNASGMLKCVTRPDGNTVEFTYDALGRRLSKTYHNTTTRWVWDGNTPLHEWKEDLNSGNVLSETSIDKDGIVTWVFETGSFVPAAKLKGEKNYSIVTDHLGTPFQMYNAEGQKFWECELDTYGKVRISEGDKGSCPFRYQGQYEDVETGLYYNRFRYYDPEDGVYVSQDPILIGGGNNLYSYVTDTNIHNDAFGLSSKTLNRNLGGVSKDSMQAHHLIPEEVWQDKEYEEMFNDLGMEMDDKTNGILLPGSNQKRVAVGAKVFHNGSHPKYSEFVRNEVAKIKKQWKPGMNDDTTKAKLKRLQRRLKEKIITGNVERGNKSCNKLG